MQVDGRDMTQLRILIAEDEKVTQRLYQVALPTTFCQQKIVGDGEEAIRQYLDWKPDILLLDIGMPNLNGYQVLKTIREEQRDKSTVIIMATGQADRDFIVSCAKLGVQGYIVKPFVAKDLAAKIVTIYRASQKKKAG